MYIPLRLRVSYWLKRMMVLLAIVSVAGVGFADSSCIKNGRNYCKLAALACTNAGWRAGVVSTGSVHHCVSRIPTGCYYESAQFSCSPISCSPEKFYPDVKYTKACSP